MRQLTITTGAVYRRLVLHAVEKLAVRHARDVLAAGAFQANGGVYSYVIHVDLNVFTRQSLRAMQAVYASVEEIRERTPRTERHVTASVRSAHDRDHSSDATH